MVEVVKLQLNFPVFMNSRIDIKVLCFMPVTNISSWRRPNVYNISLVWYLSESIYRFRTTYVCIG